jgi:hypothetical protein
MAVRAVSARLRAVLPEQEPEYVGLVYALVLVWGLGDVVSTYFAYAAIGTGSVEANPWIGVMLQYNPLLVLAVKAAVVLYTGVVLLEAGKFVRRTPGWRLWLSGLVVAGILVVVNNLLVGIRVLLRG